MPRIDFGTIAKLLVWSLVVGAILAFLDLSPADVLAGVVSWAEGVIMDVRASTTQLLTWLLWGAAIVLPIFALNYLWRALKGRG